VRGAAGGDLALAAPVALTRATASLRLPPKDRLDRP